MNSIIGAIARDISQLIFCGRWVLAPMYVALVPVAMIYVYKFFRGLVELLMTASTLSDTDLLLGILHLLDMVMVGNLIVTTMIGGFCLFVRRIEIGDPNNRLSWLEHIDPTTLKLKLGMAFIGVSSVHLLEAFIGAAGKSWSEIMKLVVIHLVFVVSTVTVAMLSRKEGHK